MASNSIESLDFLEDFLSKINELTVDNFVMEISNETLNNGTDIFKLGKTNYNNLKLWSPPTLNEREELFNLTNRRIYKGKRTRIKKYPFMASVHVINEFMCAGSIISKNFVITAASCLQIVFNNKKFRENPSSIFIRVGSDYTKRYGETIPIRELHFHPEYEPFSLKNNLALLKIARPLKSLKKKRKVRRIQYDRTKMKLVDGEVTIIGWGATDDVIGVKKYQPLAVANIDVYDFDKCQEIYSKNYVIESNFCVGFVSKGGGACNKDVGGPGIVNGVLVGVISFGPPVCGTPGMPTVLVKLGYYATWIESVINQASTSAASAKFRTSAQAKTAEFPPTSTKLEERYPLNPNYVRTGTKQDYPEEVAILNQILNDVILSNKTVVDDILYGALEDDFSDIFKPSTKVKIHEHPLANKSLFLLPEIHDFGKEHQPNVTEELTTSSPLLTTTHPGLNVHYLDDYGERIRYLEAAYHLMTILTLPTPRTPTTTEEPRHITDRIGRASSITLLELDDTDDEYSKVVSSEDSEQVSDNYEDQSKEIYEESEGMSIDVEAMTEREVTYLTPISNIERVKDKEYTFFVDRNVNKHNPKIMEAKSKMFLKKPYTSKGMRKATRILYKKKLFAENDEKFRSKTQKRKKIRFRFQ
ncbi:uncharacterized protein LOC115445311 [Manduca sexta]|uniref:uncharacterized protein LOC115445311 n=1 Tax=Manduca sexta TaxID=7130 RepID=UPI0018902DCF|nr:uncharacterized protein LOC115445311 [Manduca sexta]